MAGVGRSAGLPLNCSALPRENCSDPASKERVGRSGRRARTGCLRHAEYQVHSHSCANLPNEQVVCPVPVGEHPVMRRRSSDHSLISVSDLGYPASGTAAPRACALALAMFGDVARPCAHWSRLERDRPGPVAVLQRPASDPDSAVASRSDGSLQAGVRGAMSTPSAKKSTSEARDHPSHSCRSPAPA
jgi:hypothetical protein